VKKSCCLKKSKVCCLNSFREGFRELSIFNKKIWREYYLLRTWCFDAALIFHAIDTQRFPYNVRYSSFVDFRSYLNVPLTCNAYEQRTGMSGLCVSFPPLGISVLDPSVCSTMLSVHSWNDIELTTHDPNNAFEFLKVYLSCHWKKSDINKNVFFDEC
jgi:hypothetical protein